MTGGGGGVQAGFLVTGFTSWFTSIYGVSAKGVVKKRNRDGQEKRKMSCPLCDSVLLLPRRIVSNDGLIGVLGIQRKFITWRCRRESMHVKARDLSDYASVHA